MKANVLSITILLSAVLLLIGCTTRELSKFADNSSCETTFEGNYYKEISAKTSAAAVFLEMELHPKLLTGKLISIDSLGIWFDPDNIGFYDQEETFFSYDTLYGVIDSIGKLVYGNIPDFYAVNFDLVFEFENTKTKKTNIVHSTCNGGRGVFVCRMGVCRRERFKR